MATRLLLEGRRCVGVAFRQRGKDREARAAREVILCGGSVNSPHLLQISGIGPAEHLQSIGVAVRARPARRRRQSAGPLRRARLASSEECGVDQPARARRPSCGGGGAVRRDRPRRVDLRRDQRAGVLPLARRLASPDLQLLFTPASYDAARFGATGARARHDGGGLPGASGQPRHDHGAFRRSVCRAGHHAELSVGPERPARAERWHADHAARSSPAPAMAQHSVAETLPGPICGVRRRVRRLFAPLRHDDIPPGRHVPHGRRTWRRGRLTASRARHRRICG